MAATAARASGISMLAARPAPILRKPPLPTRRKAPSIATSSPLPTAPTGAAYSQTLMAAGTTPITWAVTSGTLPGGVTLGSSSMMAAGTTREMLAVTGGALPAGLSIGSSTGIISGTPTAAGVFTFTVSATNAVGRHSKQLSLTVTAAPTAPAIVTIVAVAQRPDRNGLFTNPDGLRYNSDRLGRDERDAACRTYSRIIHRHHQRHARGARRLHVHRERD